MLEATLEPSLPNTRLKMCHAFIAAEPKRGSSHIAVYKTILEGFRCRQPLILFKCTPQNLSPRDVPRHLNEDGAERVRRISFFLN